MYRKDGNQKIETLGFSGQHMYDLFDEDLVYMPTYWLTSKQDVILSISKSASVGSEIQCRVTTPTSTGCVLILN